METQIEYLTPEIIQTTDTALVVIDAARSVVIATTTDYQFAQGLMGDIKSRIKLLEETRMGQTRPLDESKKRILDFFRAPLQKLEDAKAHLNNIMVRWVEDQEKIRREEERRLQEEARKRAEDEAIRQALEAEAAGETQEAEAILQEPVYVPPIKVNSTVPKSKESHVRETWSCEVVDLKALVVAIAQGKAPLQAVEADMAFLNGQARSYKQALSIPGVKPVSKKTQI
jgi:hypothetical protein